MSSCDLQVVVDAEIGDDHTCIIYLRDDSHSKIVCETVLDTMTCGEIATLLMQRNLAVRFEKDFAVYAFNAKGKTVQVTLLSTAFNSETHFLQLPADTRVKYLVSDPEEKTVSTTSKKNHWSTSCGYRINFRPFSVRKTVTCAYGFPITYVAFEKRIFEPCLWQKNSDILEPDLRPSRSTDRL